MAKRPGFSLLEPWHRGIRQRDLREATSIRNLAAPREGGAGRSEASRGQHAARPWSVTEEQLPGHSGLCPRRGGGGKRACEGRRVAPSPRPLESSLGCRYRGTCLAATGPDVEGRQAGGLQSPCQQVSSELTRDQKTVFWVCQSKNRSMRAPENLLLRKNNEDTGEKGHSQCFQNSRNGPTFSQPSGEC